jgi:hypothetical protein
VEIIFKILEKIENISEFKFLDLILIFGIRISPMAGLRYIYFINLKLLYSP